MPRYPRGHRPEGNSLGQCINCWEPVEVVVAEWYDDSYYANSGTPKREYYRHTRRKQPQTARDRWFCSVCGRKGEWYEFDGSGRGAECQP